MSNNENKITNEELQNKILKNLKENYINTFCAITGIFESTYSLEDIENVFNEYYNQIINLKNTLQDSDINSIKLANNVLYKNVIFKQGILNFYSLSLLHFCMESVKIKSSAKYSEKYDLQIKKKLNDAIRFLKNIGIILNCDTILNYNIIPESSKEEKEVFKTANKFMQGKANYTNIANTDLYWTIIQLSKIETVATLIKENPLPIYFISYFTFSDTPENLMKQINRFLISNFYVFTELGVTNKQNFYCELYKMQHRYKQENKDYIDSLFSYHTIDEIMQWLNFEAIFRNRNGNFEIIKTLIEKIFLNIDLIEINKINFEKTKINSKIREYEKITKTNISKEDIYYQETKFLFLQIVGNFKDELYENPGIIACLYLLIKEMPEDDILSIFHRESESLKADKDAFDIKITETYLRQFKLDNPSKYNHLIKNIEQSLKETQINLENSNLSEYSNDKENLKLLQNLLYFAIWGKMGNYIYNDNIMDIDSENPNNEIYWKLGISSKIDSRRNLIKPFFNFVYSKMSMPSTKEMAKIYNNSANFLNLCKYKDSVPVFKEIDFANFNDNTLVVYLLINLSKIEMNSKSGLINQINILRESQKKLLPCGYKYVTAEINRNHKRLEEIDTGFYIADFLQQFYPFSANPFYDNLEMEYGSPIIMRDVTCKLFKETNLVYVEKENDDGYKVDYRATNKKDLSIRLLYHDRNSATHFANNKDVDNLLHPKEWESLLYVLEDFKIIMEKHYKNIESNITKNTRIYELFSHSVGALDNSLKSLANNQKIDIFIYYCLFKEIEYISNTVIKKIASIKEIAIDESKLEVNNIEYFIDFFCKSTNSTKIKNYRFYNDIKLSEDENIFFDNRLEDLLKIMFFVNGTNKQGSDHNQTREEFFMRYNSEISLYLFNITLQLQSIDVPK